MLHTLPDLAFDLVWNLLDQNDRFNIRLLSKANNMNSSPRLFSTFTITDYDSQKFQLLPTYGHYVKRVSVREVEFNIIDFFQKTRNIDVLELVRVDLKTGEGFTNKTLRTLKLKVDGRFSGDKDILVWGPLITNLQRLIRLELTEFDPVTAQYLFYNLPTLESFKLVTTGPIIPKVWKPAHLKKLTNNFDSEFKQNFLNPRLKTLDIKCSLKFSVDQDLFHITPTNFPNLRNLILNLYDGYLLTIKEHKWFKLGHLAINYKDTDPELLSTLVANCTKLSYLHCHKLSPHIQLPLVEYFNTLSNLTHLFIDLSNCDLDIVTLEDLLPQRQTTHLGIQFSFLALEKLRQVSQKFPNVTHFEFMGAIQSIKAVTFELARLAHGDSIDEIKLYFPWKILVIPDFNPVLIEVIKLCPSLSHIYHRFYSSEIPVHEAKVLLKYTHPELNIDYAHSLSSIL